MSYLNIKDHRIREAFYTDELNRKILASRISAIEVGVSSARHSIVEDSSHLNSNDIQVRDVFDSQLANVRDLQRRIQLLEEKTVLLGESSLKTDTRTGDASLEAALQAQDAQLSALAAQRDALRDLKNQYASDYQAALDAFNDSVADLNTFNEMIESIGRGQNNTFTPPLWAKCTFSNLTPYGVDLHFDNMTTSVDLCIIEANRVSGDCEISYNQDYDNVGQGSSKATRWCITSNNWNDNPANLNRPDQLGYSNSVTINANFFHSGTMGVHFFVASIYNTWAIEWMAGWNFSFIP